MRRLWCKLFGHGKLRESFDAGGLSYVWCERCHRCIPTQYADINSDGSPMWLATSEHVIPMDDLRPHEESSQCWCRPFDEDGIWVHNSMDKRELAERGEIVPS